MEGSLLYYFAMVEGKETMWKFTGASEQKL